MSQAIQTRYQRLVEAGTIERDPAQMLLIERFAELNEALKKQELASKKS